MAALLNGVTESIYTNAKYKVYEQAVLCTPYFVWNLNSISKMAGNWWRGRGGIYVRVEGGEGICFSDTSR